MPEDKRVLVTGVGSYWGGRVAARLLAEPDLHVIGLDVAAPKEPIAGLDLIQADVRNPLLSHLLAQERVDTVCHLALLESSSRSEAAFDLNVMGTMKVFGAAAEAGVRKIVFKSSTMVYGARPDNAAFLAEGQPLTNNKVWPALSHLLEIESFCNGFRGQYPDITLTVLRFPGIVGPTADTPMNRFLKLPAVPFLMGFDPQMQVIHEDDVVDALAHAVLHDAPGVFNVAAEGIVPLSRLLGLAGRIGAPIFHLAAYWGNPLLGGLGFPVRRAWPLGLDYLRYPWVGDLARMRAILEFVPRYTGPEALREFAGRQRLKGYRPAETPPAQDEGRLRDTLERRRRARERLGTAAAGTALDHTQSAVADDEREEVVL